MQTLEFLSGLIELNLRGLSFGYFLLKLLAFVANFNREFFDLKGKFFDFGLVSSPVLLQSQIIFLLLACCQCPLLKLLLVPVHFKFKLVHSFVRFKNHVLDIVETVLLISYALLKLLNLVLKSARLALGNLLHVLFCFDFLVLSINKTLRVHKLHLDRFEMFSKDLKSLLVFFYLESELGNQAHLFTDNLVELLILVVGVGREVLV